MFANIKKNTGKKGAFKIKKDFNEVVRENTDFVMSIVRKFVRNPEIAKDLTQEIFIKAYLNYDYYTETGKIKAWLSVIANNKLKNYYKTEKCRSEQAIFLPLEDFMPSNEEASPENITEQKDFTERIVNIINTLPQRQRDAVFYSVIYQYSEKEIAAMQNIPVGSVKSAKHYGLEKVKKIILETNLMNNNDLIRKVKNNMSKLTKQEAYELLYQYAKNHISSENKAAVEDYIKTDEECANIAEALREVHGKLTFAGDHEKITGHYNIMFALKSSEVVIYSNMGFPMNKEDCEKGNAYLETHDGNIPPEENWFSHGSDGTPNTSPSYDNEGNIMTFIGNYNEQSNHTRYHCAKMKKFYYPIHWQYSVYYRTDNNSYPGNVFKKLDIAPNLYEAKIQNHFGGKVKSGLYLALPENAVNIRINRGNGVLECGKYKFLYADRYLAADEGIFAECTFNLSE